MGSWNFHHPRGEFVEWKMIWNGLETLKIDQRWEVEKFHETWGIHLNDKKKIQDGEP